MARHFRPGTSSKLHRNPELAPGALYPGRGRVCRVGITSSLLDVYSGMKAEASGWDNIMLRGLFLGLSPAEIRSRTDNLVGTGSVRDMPTLYHSQKADK